MSVKILAYGCVMHYIYKQEGTRHVGVVSFLSFHSLCDKTSVVGESYLISQLFYDSKDLCYKKELKYW